jgi:hypothetical protein
MVGRASGIDVVGMAGQLSACILSVGVAMAGLALLTEAGDGTMAGVEADEGPPGAPCCIHAGSVIPRPRPAAEGSGCGGKC